MSALLFNVMDLLDCNALLKTLFSVHLKHSIILPTADDKPMSNDLVMQCPGSECLSVRVYGDLYAIH
jgi:hypothetical protein